MSEFHQSLIGVLAKLNHLSICGILSTLRNSQNEFLVHQKFANSKFFSVLKNHLNQVSYAISMPPALNCEAIYGILIS